MKKIGQLYGKVMKKHEKMETKAHEMKETGKKKVSRVVSRLKKYL